ncbi:YtxH domain-containing protein [Ferdinandcohnia quinoae]|uniref:YtxH domain-containing protein n=1 Tax=Fredinandcohnia quinoae TaxID=2918902 RepID=A0AAW5DY97_9BACI|nr:YtxH domain-containing protein [Fredinandcohnia sp. SECRCQ15]MCH1625343.1 YtxH domain-containing protein [Fredinandcohnia sp. SECRCQ15]
MAKGNGGKTFIIGTIVGSVVGAATALFLTPKNGQEIRQKLTSQASVVKEKTNSLSKTISEQSNQIISKVKGGGAKKNDEVVQQPNEQSETVSSNTSNEQLFQAKLAEAQKALTDAESGLNQ